MTDNYVMEWLKKADADISVARLLFEEFEDLSIISFHCQQAAEKYLKAFLSFKKVKIPKTHDIDVLYLLCLKKSSEISKINRELLSVLTDFAVEYRYPIMDAPPEHEEVRLYLEISSELGEHVRKMIENAACN